jgi:hypothetical protein
LGAELLTVKGTSIAVPAEKVFLMIVLGKADSLMPVRERAAFLMIVIGKVVFRMTAPERGLRVRIVLLTENRALNPAGLVTATSLFSAIGRVLGPNSTVLIRTMVFLGIFSHNCTDISANRRS